MTQQHDNENAGATLAAGQCPVCGSLQALVAYSDETETVRVRHLVQEIHGMAGERCRVCGETFADSASTARWSEVATALVAKARADEGAELRRVRQKLRLSQVQAAALTGGGHNGFNRYETGKAQPVPAVVNLFRLLDKHPQLLQELEPINATGNKRAKAGEAVTVRAVKPPRLLRGVLRRKQQAANAQAKGKAAAKKAQDVAALVVATAKKKGSSPKAGTPTPRRPVAPGRR